VVAASIGCRGRAGCAGGDVDAERRARDRAAVEDVLGAELDEAHEGHGAQEAEDRQRGQGERAKQRRVPARDRGQETERHERARHTEHVFHRNANIRPAIAQG
jgi:hypothetical protein